MTTRLYQWFLVSGLALSLLAGVAAPVVVRKLNRPTVYTSAQPIIYTQPVTAAQTGPIPKKAGPAALLPGATWVPQTFNNCGPASVSMVLQYFGHSVSQEETKSKLRTNPDDRNVFTPEIQAYLKNDFGIESKLVYGGDVGTLKQLVANGFYVVVEDVLHPHEDIGHTTIIRGYDDAKGVFIADDSYLGNTITYPYEQFDRDQWKPLNREYLPVYLPENEALAHAIIGSSWDEQTMFAHAADLATQEIGRNDKDMYAWFNLGTSLFGQGKYTEAKVAFETSKTLGWPKRILWYQIQPVITYNKLGEYDAALSLARIGLTDNGSFAELHMESAIAYNGLGNGQMAKTEMQEALRLSPHLPQAADFLASL